MKYEIIGNFYHSEELETDKTGKELFKYYSEIVESEEFKNKAVLCHASCTPIIICPKCNRSIETDSYYCKHCGTNIKKYSAETGCPHKEYCIQGDNYIQDEACSESCQYKKK